MKMTKVAFSVLCASLLLNLALIACGGSSHMLPPVPPVPVPIAALLHHLSHRQTAGSGLHSNKVASSFVASNDEEDGIVRAQAPTPTPTPAPGTTTQSLEARCKVLPAMDTDLVMEGGGRDEGNPDCSTTFTSFAFTGAPIAVDGTLQNLHCFGRNPAFANSGTMHVFVIAKGTNIETDTGITCTLGVGTGLVFSTDSTHTFAVHQGDQWTVHVHSVAGDTLTNLDALAEVL